MGTSLPGLPRGPRPPRLGSLREPSRPEPPRLRGMRPVDGVEDAAPFPDPPSGWQGGAAAWAIYWAHGPLKRGPEGELWYYTAPLFGSVAVTGFVADFIEKDAAVSIDVLDEERQTLGQARSVQALRRLIMARFGVRHVAIDEGLALTRPIFALRDALAGVSHSRVGA